MKMCDDVHLMSRDLDLDAGTETHDRLQSLPIGPHHSKNALPSLTGISIANFPEEIR
jgi:hypothetical protein